jgi:hypothetical protein
MRSKTNIVVAFALAGFFTVFNVGLPIVLFVCPMMSDGQVCDCKPMSTDTPAFTYEAGSCCTHTVIAERNTIPFLGAAKFQTPSAEVVLVLSPEASLTVEQSQLVPAGVASDTGPPGSVNPIYIITSALLI